MSLLRLRFTNNEKTFRSGRIAFTDAHFSQLWSQRYDEFLKEAEDLVFLTELLNMQVVSHLLLEQQEKNGG